MSKIRAGTLRKPGKKAVITDTKAPHTNRNVAAFQLKDHRPGTLAQLKLQEQMAQHTLSRYAGQKENTTGLPQQLKSGAERLSGYALDDVTVHYNSAKPAQLQAHAYTQGTDIHVAPGQEKHLPHETWHVVQQKQGRVKPTVQMKGANINDDAGLEQEADVMGAKASQQKQSDAGNAKQTGLKAAKSPVSSFERAIQRVIYKGPRTKETRKYYPRELEYSGDFEDQEGDPVTAEDFLEFRFSKDKYYIQNNKLYRKIEKKRKRKEKSKFVKRHEKKSKIAKNRTLKRKTREDTADLFESSKRIRKSAIETPGNPVYMVYKEIKKIYDEEIDKNSTERFTKHLRIDDVPVTVNIPNQQNIENVKDVLALTHITLQGTKGKSSYPAMVEGGMYPNTNTVNNKRTKYLSALEAARRSKFIPGLILKPSSIDRKDITMEDTIDPEKYGTHEMSGVAGKKRSDFNNAIIDNTARLLENTKDDKLKDIMSDKNKYEEYKEECKDSCSIM